MALIKVRTDITKRGLELTLIVHEEKKNSFPGALIF